jgi:hypothetical protein
MLGAENVVFSLTGLALRNDKMFRQAIKTKIGWLGVGAVLSVGLFPSAGSADEQDEEVKRTGGKPGCFYAREASDFEALDDSNLIVYAPTKSRAYHVQISPPSSDLRFAQGVVFDARSGRICGRGGETVSFGRRSGSARRHSVMNVWHLEPEQVEQLKDLYKAPDGDSQIEPKDSEGAEVERDLSSNDKDT